MKPMKICMIAALMAASGSVLAAEVYAVRPGDRVVLPGERVIIEGRAIPGGGIASGGTSLEDMRLADDVAIALHDSRRIAPATTATVVANRGEVTISGSTDNYEKAQRAEHIARNAAGPHRVAGFIATAGGA